MDFQGALLINRNLKSFKRKYELFPNLSDTQLIYKISFKYLSTNLIFLVHTVR